LTAGDTDTFKFISPSAPRDLVQVEVANVDGTLELGLPVSDDLTRYLAQPPNTPLFLQLWGAHSTTGAYRVSLHALKAFDVYKPNDDIFSAHRIELGEKVKVNIMGSDDTDVYVFQSPRSPRRKPAPHARGAGTADQLFAGVVAGAELRQI